MSNTTTFFGPPYFEAALGFLVNATSAGEGLLILIKSTKVEVIWHPSGKQQSLLTQGALIETMTLLSTRTPNGFNLNTKITI